MDKETARKTGLRRRSFLNTDERAQYAYRIQEQVIAILRDCRKVCCYVSKPDEADTSRILDWCFARYGSVIVPKVAGDTLELYEITSREDLAPGSFGVAEPAGGIRRDIAECGAVIVPVCAFDEHCHRAGYGKGYYDSILSGASRRIGIAFEVQKTEPFEPDPWDVPLDLVITENGRYMP